MTLGIILLLIAGAVGIILTKKYKEITLLALGVGIVLSIISLLGDISSNGNILTSAFVFFFLLIGLLVMWESFSLIGKDLEDSLVPVYYTIVLVLLASLCGIIYFDNLLVLYFTLEISAFLSAGLVIIKKSERSRRAGMKYLFLSLLASVFFLIGIVITYRLTGSLSINNMDVSSVKVGNEDLIGTSLLFIFIGLAFKSALFPFHLWLPDAHGNATSSASAMLSGVVLKSYIILFIKLIYISFGIELVKEYNILNISLTLGTIAMIYGSLLAIMQEDIKYRIAYSSVAQIGYIFMGLGLGNEMGLIAALFHIISHGVTKSTLFLAAGNIITKKGIRNPREMNGMAKALPFTMFIYTIGALSMVGIPLFVGFMSKWNFAQGIMEYESIVLLVVLTLSSILNGIYFMPLVIRGYLMKEIREFTQMEFDLSPPFVLLASLIIITGVLSAPILNVLQIITGSFY